MKDYAKYEAMGLEGDAFEKAIAKVAKSLGNKRNELSPEHIAELVRLHGDFEQNGLSEVKSDGQIEKQICSKIFANAWTVTKKYLCK